MNDQKNADKTKNLAERLCRYYGIRIYSTLIPCDMMKLTLSDGKFMGYFYTYDEILFGTASKYGLNDTPDRQWMAPALLNPPFKFFSIEELEMQLSIRGF